MEVRFASTMVFQQLFFHKRQESSRPLLLLKHSKYLYLSKTFRLLWERCIKTVIYYQRLLYTVIDTYTYLIYFMLLFSVTILSSNRVTKLFRRKNEAILSNKLHANHLTILLIIVVIVGFRYNVGTDWLNYKSYYETQSGLDLYNYKQEYGFAFLMQLFQYYNISYSGFLIITALVPWVLILKAHYTKYLPLIRLILVAFIL